MKVLHVNQTADRGGAALAMMGLHRSLRASAIDSRVLVASTSRPGPGVTVIPPPSLVDRALYHAVNLAGLNYYGLTGARRILDLDCLREADVVHLHNLHGGYFNILWLTRLTALKPVVWTLHDMWALTGHCGYSLNCERWRTGCGHCPYPRVYPPVRLDATRLDWKLKRRVYSRSAFTMTCPSRWLADLARDAACGHGPVRHVPNAVDTDTFRPRDRDACRRSEGLDVDALVVLFVAESLDNPYKDFALLVRALERLPDRLKPCCRLVTMGGGGENAGTLCGIPTHRLGYIRDVERRARVFAAADVFAFATRADNQPLVVLEAMACGCPVVSVDVGGLPELVRPDETGCLVEAGDADGFAREMTTLLDDRSRRRLLSENARTLVQETYTLERQANEMSRVYEEAVSRRGEER